MTETLKKLIEILQDGKFHSGEQIGKSLNITRSAIWKLMKQLSTRGLEIESVTNKGYRMSEPLILLEKEKILSLLSQKSIAQLDELDVLESIPSTNDYLLDPSKVKSKKTIACLAECQTRGKGRRGRTWVSPFAKNIYLSLLWHFKEDPSALAGLSLAIAISIIEALEMYGITQTLGVKWPNDLYCNDHKLAGILIELSGEVYDTCSAVIGLGLNVYMPKTYQDGISQPFTHLQALSTEKIDRNKIASLLLHGLIQTILVFEREGFEPFRKRWSKYDLTLGKPVSVITAGHTFEGIGRGIDQNGLFLLEDKTGTIKSFSSAEVSIRFNQT